jgi:hypothetical protein
LSGYEAVSKQTEGERVAGSGPTGRPRNEPNPRINFDICCGQYCFETDSQTVAGDVASGDHPVFIQSFQARAPTGAQFESPGRQPWETPRDEKEKPQRGEIPGVDNQFNPADSAGRTEPIIDPGPLCPLREGLG